MKLSEFKQYLNTAQSLSFVLPNGASVPAHFHITEAGLTTKHFIDCGGDVHTDKLVNFQIWVAGDLEHRLKPGSLLKIIEMSDKILTDDSLEIEVEYQTDTIGKYGVSILNDKLQLVPKNTDCLAKVKCDIAPVEGNACCTPGGGCC